MLDVIFSILATYYLNFIPDILRPSQKVKLRIQYKPGVALYIRRGPAQYVPYDLILWYVSKTIYLS